MGDLGWIVLVVLLWVVTMSVVVILAVTRISSQDAAAETPEPGDEHQ